jgi:Protein of unknown function (DUF2786)
MENLSDKQKEVIEQVQKLLALSKSSNEHEAALALARAEFLLEKYRLDMTQIELMGGGKEAIIEDNDPLFDSEHLEPWESQLAHGVAWIYGCTTIRLSNKIIRIIGRPSDIMFVRYLVTYITLELFRFSAALYKKRKDYKNAYFLGAVAIIIKRLKEAQKETQAQYENPFAVATVNNRYEESQKKLDELHPDAVVAKHESRKPINQEAYWLGQEAGRKIKLSQDRKLAGAKPTLT